MLLIITLLVLYRNVPVQGKRKTISLYPNMVLFNVYGIERFDKERKIQPLPTFRPKSQLHVWEFSTYEQYVDLFKNWDLENIPEFKKFQRKTSQHAQFSFIWIDTKHPFVVSYSKNTGLLILKFYYQISTKGGFTLNSQ